MRNEEKSSGCLGFILFVIIMGAIILVLKAADPSAHILRQTPSRTGLGLGEGGR